VRARGLWAGVDISPELSTGRHVCEQLLEHGILAKEAHGQTLRLAPPLVASEEDIELLVSTLRTICTG
jgi:ornithine--oxo-acid transaminase